MGTQEHNGSEPDWDFSEDYYREETKKELKLEDFIEESSAGFGVEDRLDASAAADGELQRVAADAARVMELSGQGKTAAEIAAELGAEISYISDIMVCIQAFPEDGPLAAARLLVMG